MNFKFENIEIKAIYSTVPQKKIVFNELDKLFGEDGVEKVTNITGISSVRVVDSQTTASDLCAFSASKLLKELGISSSEIDGLIFVVPSVFNPAKMILLLHCAEPFFST